QRMIRTYKIEAIAIGNGTASRESKEFVGNSLTPQPPLRRERGREALPSSPEGGRVPMRTREDKGTLNLSQHLSEVSASLSPPLSGRSGGASPIFLISEDGASIYSASPVAREEFPNEDVTTRGAISIGRRLMDPLAELVKIDPKSIGVGQYQHDVDQSKLKHSLDQTVMSCVNQVGVNLNTASLHLLTYVSGLGPALARNIIDYRREHGPFTSRAQLKKVKRLGDTAYQQCAG
ncbi:MAG: helix-hairpin-helix domain-containing protein, partial [Prevotella sp.]|uniref:helix-hairpin-helix domain-containing protein n=1 Tax=Prevotella sp. TaxID=59823 RepID=UPI001CAEDBE4